MKQKILKRFTNPMYKVLKVYGDLQQLALNNHARINDLDARTRELEDRVEYLERLMYGYVIGTAKIGKKYNDSQ